jgi:hypothetical protein
MWNDLTGSVSGFLWQIVALPCATRLALREIALAEEGDETCGGWDSNQLGLGDQIRSGEGPVFVCVCVCVCVFVHSCARALSLICDMWIYMCIHTYVQAFA